MRPDKDLYFMRMARLAATRTTCLRRAVGCVLTDELGRVLSTGYNGVPRGAPHCNELVIDLTPVVTAGFSIDTYPNACEGASLSGGARHDLCGAVHAEQNAILQCRDPDRIHSVYVTVAPCDPCLKLLINTGMKRLVVGAWWNDNEAQVKARLPAGVVALLDERV